jgi:hypothetical protein
MIWNSKFCSMLGLQCICFGCEYFSKSLGGSNAECFVTGLDKSKRYVPDLHVRSTVYDGFREGSNKAREVVVLPSGKENRAFWSDHGKALLWSNAHGILLGYYYFAPT